jgi:hypothetical protein
VLYKARLIEFKMEDFPDPVCPVIANRSSLNKSLLKSIDIFDLILVMPSIVIF